MQVWPLPDTYPDTPTVVPQDACIASVNTHARITCMAITGSHQDVVPPHVPSAPPPDLVALQTKAVSKAAAKRAVRKARAKQQQHDSDDDDEGAQVKRKPVDFTVVRVSARAPAVPVAPEQPRGAEEDDHQQLQTQLIKAKKTVKREQRKRMFALKRQAAKSQADE